MFGAGTQANGAAERGTPEAREAEADTAEGGVASCGHPVASPTPEGSENQRLRRVIARLCRRAAGQEGAAGLWERAA